MSSNNKSTEIVKGALKGAVKGSATGSVASLVTGAAVTCTAPAWLPFVGGSMLVVGTTVALWGAIGASVGALTGGAWSWWEEEEKEAEFRKLFEEQNKPK